MTTLTLAVLHQKTHAEGGGHLPVSESERVRSAHWRAGKIREHLAKAATEYAEAVLQRDWEVLGYESLAAWAADVLDSRRFTVKARQQVTELLLAGGHTVKEIEQATQVSHSVAVEDTKAVREAGGRKPTTSSPRQQAALDREAAKREAADEPELPEPDSPPPPSDTAPKPEPEPETVKPEPDPLATETAEPEPVQTWDTMLESASSARHPGWYRIGARQALHDAQEAARRIRAAQSVFTDLAASPAPLGAESLDKLTEAIDALDELPSLAVEARTACTRFYEAIGAIKEPKEAKSS